MELSNKELNCISGGISVKGLFIIGGVFTFLIGIIDGFTKPLKCN